MDSIDSMERRDRIKQNAGKLGKGLATLILVVGFFLAVIGALTVVGEVPAFLQGDGFESVEMIRIGDTSKVLVDQDGDSDIDLEVSIQSLAAFRDMESGEIFLSVMGDTSTSGQ